MDSGPSIWDGELLGSERVALFLCGTQPSARSEPPELMFGAASTGEVNVGLLREQIGLFLRWHRDVKLICHNAAALHWLVHDFLEQRKDLNAIGLLWDLSRDCRLLDVALLDQHVRRIQKDGLTPEPAPLARLAEWYGGGPIPGKAEVRRRIGSWPPTSPAELDPSRLEVPLRIACALVKVYEALQRSVEQIEGDVRKRLEDSEPVPVAPDLDPPLLPPQSWGAAPTPPSRRPVDDGFPKPTAYGPLGIGLDVMGAIAFRQAERLGLGVDVARLPELLLQSEKLYARASQSLQSGKALGGRRKWQGGTVARDRAGEPAGARAALPAVLQRKTKELCDRMGCDPLLSQKASGDLSNLVADLGVWAGCDPELRTWSELIRAADVSKFATTCQAEVISPRFKVQPRLSSSRPNLDCIRALGVPVFRPRPRHTFLVIRLEELQLPCLAAFCRFRFHRLTALLYHVFRSEKEPLHALAKRLFEYRGGGYSDEASRQFERLRRVSPEEYERWLRLTRGLLETLPLGLPSPLLQGVLQDEYGIVEVSEWEIERLAGLILREVAWELRLFMGYDLAEATASNTGLAENSARKRLGLGPWLNPDNRPRHDRTQARVLRDIVRGKRSRPVKNLVGDQVASSDAPGPSNQPKVGPELLRVLEPGMGGRVTSRWYPAEVRRQAWAFLVDDVIKLIAYVLTTHAFHLIALVDQEFVVEVPSERANDATIRQIESLCRQAAGELLGAAGLPCRCTWQDGWPVSASVTAGSVPPPW